MRSALSVVALGLACSAGEPSRPLANNSEPQPPAPAQTQPAPETEPAPPAQLEPQGPSKVRTPDPPPSLPLRSEITLGPLDPSRKSAADENGLRRIGAHRTVPALPPPAIAWTTTADGEPIWRTVIRSPGAFALRIHFLDFHLGDGSVEIHAAGDESGAAPRRRYEGSGPAGDGELWSDIIEGEAVTVEYRPETADTAGGDVPFRIDKISHLWQSPLAF